MTDITGATVNAYIAKRVDAEAAPATINRELAWLKHMFTLAMRAGKLMARPHIALLRENNVRAGFFEPAQYEAVLEHLPDDLRPVVQFAYLTGWRVKSEVLTLKWEQVQGDQLRLEPGTTKNKEGRVFPITRDLRAVLDAQEVERKRLAKRGRVVYHVFHRNGTRIKSMTKAWQSACAKAGCPDRILHDLRRTAVRNFVRAGVPERVCMALTGHKTRSVFERYNIVSGGDLRDAARRLDGVAGVAAAVR
jgi:integrase